MATCNSGSCVVSFRVTCWLIIILWLIYFLLSTFPFQLCISLSDYLIYNKAQFLCNFHFLIWLLLWMLLPVIGPFIFRVLDCHNQLVDPGQFLCVRLILLCKNFRHLPYCCIEWLFSYQVMWLPCIRISVLLMLIHVIKVIQYLLFFPDWPARY